MFRNLKFYATEVTEDTEKNQFSDFSVFSGNFEILYNKLAHLRCGLFINFITTDFTDFHKILNFSFSGVNLV